MTTYLDDQRAHAISLTRLSGDPLDLGTTGAPFMGSARDFVLQDGVKNLHAPIRTPVVEYFQRNGVGWWGGKKVPGHLLSSQVACVNHLFAWRHDAHAALAVLQGLDPEFEEALHVPGDSFSPGYVQFEAVSDHQYLNERGLTRGSQCTSLDAIMFGRLKSGDNVLVAIEWKYTEAYGNTDKSAEGMDRDPSNCRGMQRQRNYNGLIQNSAQLAPADWHICYYEPFYQLMRQTLWCEQRVLHRAEERLKASRYLHVHVVPRKNLDLLDKRYQLSGKGMEDTWRSVLQDQSLYRIVEPKDFVAPVVGGSAYADLGRYLDQRYWQ
jgi:hypothetical protein